MAVASVRITGFTWAGLTNPPKAQPGKALATDCAEAHTGNKIIAKDSNIGCLVFKMDCLSSGEDKVKNLASYSLLFPNLW